MRLVLSLIFTIQCAWAYPPHSLDMTEYEYRRYVRPQLKSIVQDTHTLLFLLNPEFKSYKNAFKSTKNLIKAHLELKNNCKKHQIENCTKEIKELKKILTTLNKDTEKSLDLSKKVYLNIDEKISAKQDYTNFRNQLIKAQVALDDLLLKSVVKTPETLYLKMLKHEVNLVINTYYNFITKASDNRFKTEFNSYWSTFVMPVYKHILIQDKKSYFESNINELNLRWNNLNVRLTKRNKKVSKQIKTLLNIMHNRWNNILKVSLNPQKY